MVCVHYVDNHCKAAWRRKKKQKKNTAFTPSFAMSVRAIHGFDTLAAQMADTKRIKNGLGTTSESGNCEAGKTSEPKVLTSPVERTLNYNTCSIPQHFPRVPFIIHQRPLCYVLHREAASDGQASWRKNHRRALTFLIAAGADSE